jgi:hypothetical protein
MPPLEKVVDSRNWEDWKILAVLKAKLCCKFGESLSHHLTID